MDPLQPLTDDEAQNVAPVTEDQITRALEEGFQAREAVEANTSNVFFYLFLG